MEKYYCVVHVLHLSFTVTVPSAEVCCTVNRQLLTLAPETKLCCCSAFKLGDQPWKSTHSYLEDGSAAEDSPWLSQLPWIILIALF